MPKMYTDSKKNSKKRLTLRSLSKIIPLNESINPQDSNYDWYLNEDNTSLDKICNDTDVFSTHEGKKNILEFSESLHKKNTQNKQKNKRIHEYIEKYIKNFNKKPSCPITILGSNNNLYRYFLYNKMNDEPFRMLTVSDNIWSMELNKKYIDCLFHKKKCINSPNFILIPKDKQILKKIKNDITVPTILAREMELIVKYILNNPKKVQNKNIFMIETDDYYTYDIIQIGDDESIHYHSGGIKNIYPTNKRKRRAITNKRKRNTKKNYK